MSTKIGLKASESNDAKPSFYLYKEMTFTDPANEPESPVYLRLDGVQVQMETIEGGGARVTVEIPRNMARELGLISS